MILPRFYPILDTEALSRCGVPLVEAADALIAAGVKILQLRHKGSFNRGMFEYAKYVAETCRERDVLFVVNDRADIAVLLDAGLHVGQDDLPPADARRLIGSRILGYSTHNERQLAASASEPVDYVALGPMFVTSSKQNPDPVVGIHQLRRLRHLTTRPLVAIGGISRHVAPGVLQAGADSVAIIGDLLPKNADTTALRQRAEEWMRLTDE